MQVVIFCGGQGTRMREETEFRPKPMVMVGGKPILWHIMKTYAHFGHTEFILALGYKGEMIKEYFFNYRAMSGDCTVHMRNGKETEYHDTSDESNFSVTLCNTGLETTTAERLLRVKKYLRDEPFLATYGDGLTDCDLDALVRFHKTHDAIATLMGVHTLSRFGVLDLDAHYRVRSFAEKPETDGRINAGYFVFDQKIFPVLERFKDTPLEQDTLRHLAETGKLMAFIHDGFFYAMDTYREYLHLNELWDTGEAPWIHLKSDSQLLSMIEEAKRRAPQSKSIIHRV